MKQRVHPISEILIMLVITLVGFCPAYADGDNHRQEFQDSHNNNQYDNGWHKGNDWRDNNDHYVQRDEHPSRNYDHRSHQYWRRPVVVERGPVYVAPQSSVVYYDQSQPYVQVRCTNNAITGTVLGGLAGGLIGNQFGHRNGRVYTTVGGTLIGALIGNEIGAANETCAAQALEYAAPNTQVAWQNNGASYVVEPTRTFMEDGQQCREYQTRVIIGGRSQQAYGTACRQPDGTWEPEN